MYGYDAATARDLETWAPDDAEATDAAEQIVFQVLAAHLEVSQARLALTDHLERDLGITPLGLVVIGLEIEDLQRFKITFEDLIRVKTVADLVEFVRHS